MTLLIAAVVLLWHVRSDAARFNRADMDQSLGAALGFLVWFFGFLVVGGEWFQMWKSQTWNGQQAAFSLLRDYSRSADFRQPAGRRPPKGLSSQDGARVSG